MKELQEILTRVRTLKPNESAVLATVVDVQGSSYRLPGARMLVFANNESVGVVSGGCLEADVIARAKQVIKTGEAQVFTYDTTANEESVFSLNMGCRGVIRILLERVSAENEFLKFLEACVFSHRGNAVAATMISARENSPNKIGARLLFDGQILASDFDADFQEKLLPDIQAVLEKGFSQLKAYDAREVFIEFLKPTLTLFIFGAGADAVPLCDFAAKLGWKVEVIDHRAAFATKERFPAADFIQIVRPEKFAGFTPAKGSYAAVLMTHNYSHDKELLWRLLNTDALYIGVLGPKRRTESILNELKKDEKRFPAENLEKLFAPVGLDIGADAPEAIALSVVAEIQAVLANRAGGFLKNRQGSIYNRNSF